MPLGNDDIHEEYHAFALRARMRRAYGSDRNHVIWYGIHTDLPNPLPAMDRWLRARRPRPQPTQPGGQGGVRPARGRARHLRDRRRRRPRRTRPLRADRPARAPARGAAPAGRWPPTCSSAACGPLRRSAYGPIRFTAAEWAALRRTFPYGRVRLVAARASISSRPWRGRPTCTVPAAARSVQRPSRGRLRPQRNASRAGGRLLPLS